MGLYSLLCLVAVVIVTTYVYVCICGYCCRSILPEAEAATLPPSTNTTVVAAAQLSSSTTQTTPSETDTLVEEEVTPSANNSSPPSVKPKGSVSPTAALAQGDKPTSDLDGSVQISDPNLQSVKTQTKVGRFSVGAVKDNALSIGRNVLLFL